MIFLWFLDVSCFGTAHDFVFVFLFVCFFAVCFFLLYALVFMFAAVSD